MPLFSIFGKRRNRVTEQTAADVFVRKAAYRVWHEWPGIMSQLEQMFPSQKRSK